MCPSCANLHPQDGGGTHEEVGILSLCEVLDSQHSHGIAARCYHAVVVDGAADAPGAAEDTFLKDEDDGLQGIGSSTRRSTQLVLLSLRDIIHHHHLAVQNPERTADVVAVAGDGVGAGPFLDDAHQVGVTVVGRRDGARKGGVGTHASQEEIRGTGAFFHIPLDDRAFLCIQLSQAETAAGGVRLAAQGGALVQRHMVVLHRLVHLARLQAALDVLCGESLAAVCHHHAIEAGRRRIGLIGPHVHITDESRPVGPTCALRGAQVASFAPRMEHERTAAGDS